MLRIAVALVLLTAIPSFIGCSNHSVRRAINNSLVFEFSRDELPYLGGYGFLAKLTTRRSTRGARWTVRVYEDGRVEAEVCGGPDWRPLRKRLSPADVQWLQGQKEAVSRLDSEEVALGLWSDHHAYNEMALVPGERSGRYQAPLEPESDAVGATLLSSVGLFLEERFSLPRIGDC